jgi:hypothetical protein
VNVNMPAARIVGGDEHRGLEIPDQSVLCDERAGHAVFLSRPSGLAPGRQATAIITSRFSPGIVPRWPGRSEGAHVPDVSATGVAGGDSDPQRPGLDHELERRA